MDLQLAAKGTKPGSKANQRGRNAVGRSARVPVGVLHLVDPAEQSRLNSSFVAVCGEGGLVSIDGQWDDDFDNERCEVCSDRQWAASFSDMQTKLLPGEG